MLPVPEYQTKVPLYGRDHISSRKVQAMKQAKDRKKQLARLGPTSNLDFSPPSVDKLEPEFVSEVGITEMRTRVGGKNGYWQMNRHFKLEISHILHPTASGFTRKPVLTNQPSSPVGSLSHMTTWCEQSEMPNN